MSDDRWWLAEHQAARFGRSGVVEANIGQVEDRPDGRSRLGSGQMHAQTGVGPGHERDVESRVLAEYVEPVRTLERRRIAVGAGQRDGHEVWEVHINGGRLPTGLEVVAWAREVERLGAGEIVLTSMDCDGTKDGYDIEITRAVSDAVSVPVIASGGVGNLEHLADGVEQGKADAVLAASIFHFGEATVGDAKQAMMKAGVAVRPPG